MRPLEAIWLMFPKESVARCLSLWTMWEKKKFSPNNRHTKKLSWSKIHETTVCCALTPLCTLTSIWNTKANIQVQFVWIQITYFFPSASLFILGLTSGQVAPPQKEEQAVVCGFSPQASASTVLQAHMDLTQQNIFKNICHKSPKNMKDLFSKAEILNRKLIVSVTVYILTYLSFTLMWDCCTPSELKLVLFIIQSKQCIRTQTIQRTVLTHPPLPFEHSFLFPNSFPAAAGFRPTSISGLHEMQSSSVGQQ